MQIMIEAKLGLDLHFVYVLTDANHHDWDKIKLDYALKSSSSSEL